MIRRKDSFGYIDFIRGKYKLNNIEHLQLLFNEMSLNEREKISTLSFDNLWENMWSPLSSYCSYNDDNNLYYKNCQYKTEKYLSNKKFQTLKNGLYVNNILINIQLLIKNCYTKWEETEWEFPKGRRNINETDIQCALREFKEETGYSINDIKIIDNLIPFEEIFIGSNYKAYKHKYFLAYMNEHIDNLTNYQKTEVSKIEWKTLDNCLSSIRSYNFEKKKLIININKLLQSFFIIKNY
jgi:8-oxo-dGTP pyrophosphatase MutT (NUDIX family)